MMMDHNIGFPEEMIVVTLPDYPTPDQIQQIKNAFPNPDKVIVLCGNARIALWRKQTLNRHYRAVM